MLYIDPTGHWNESLAANWSINEMKWKWQEATTRSEKDYWASEANNIRDQLRKAEYADSDILQANELGLSKEAVYKRAHESGPFLSFIAGLSEAFWDYPGEAAVVGAVSGTAKRLGQNFDEGLQFTVATTRRMEQSGRFVPVHTLQSAIKFGIEQADPQGTTAKMYYTVMYRSVLRRVYDPASGQYITRSVNEAYNLEVLYDRGSNTVMHFVYTDRALGPLPSLR